jgi:hypothetical protein
LKLTSLVLALLALAAGLVIAGCGDEDDEEPQTLTSGATGATGEAGATSTMAGFLTAADAICKEAGDELSQEAEAQYPEGPPEGDDASAFAEEVVIPALEQQYEGIAELPVPEGEEEAVEDLLTKLQAGIDDIKANPEDFVNTTALEDASAAAKDLGLKECGS